MNRLIKGMAVAVACVCLFACGQRGPLHMPKQPPQNQPNPPEVESVSLLETP